MSWHAKSKAGYASGAARRAKAKFKASLADALASRAAAALDATLALDGRGPKTFLARQRVAEALDKGKRPTLADVRWLEEVATYPTCTEGR